MDAFEKAIRNAFQKGDARDRDFRIKVYRSAFAALDRALQSNPEAGPEVAERRRKALTARITEIETEFLPPAPSLDETPSPAARGATQSPPGPREPSFDVAAGGTGSVRPSPELGPPGSRRDAPADGGFSPRIDPDDAPGAIGAADTGEIPAEAYADDRRARRRGRPWASAFIGVTLFSAVVIGGWWAYDSGLFLSSSERDGSVPNPPQELPEEDFVPEPPQGGLPAAPDQIENWIALFDPGDPTTVSAPGDSSAEVVQDGGTAAIRIRAGASGSPILFDIGQGALEAIAGRRAVFNVVAQGVDDEETQFAVECDLGALGDCGRKRYVAGSTREDFLFELELPDADPDAGGTIAINPDIEGQGRAVDIYLLRVAPVD